jgi:hypothetical protein
MSRPLPVLRIGSYRIAYQPISRTERCPCGGTITHHSAYFSGGRDEPPSEEFLHSDPCDDCGCERADECEHPNPESEESE